MKKLNAIYPQIKKYEILIASSLACVVLLFLTGIFIRPNLDKIYSIVAQRNSLEAKNKTLKAKDDILTSIDIQKYKDSFAKMSQILPDNKDYVSLFTTFDYFERQSGVTITKTSFQLGIVSTTSAKLIKKPGSAAFSVPLSFNVIGDLTSVQKFIELFKKISGRLITIDKIDLTNKENGAQELTFQGQAYFYPFPVTIGSVSSVLPKIDSSSTGLLEKISKLDVRTSADIETDTTITTGKKNLFQ